VPKFSYLSCENGALVAAWRLICWLVTIGREHASDSLVICSFGIGDRWSGILMAFCSLKYSTKLTASK